MNSPSSFQLFIAAPVKKKVAYLWVTMLYKLIVDPVISSFIALLLVHVLVLIALLYLTEKKRVLKYCMGCVNPYLRINIMDNGQASVKSVKQIH